MGRLEGLWYVATVYTSHPDGLDVAYKQANEAAARIISIYGARVFCPIAHSHSLCEVYGTKEGLKGETDEGFWKWFDEPFLERADGLIVVMMPGWVVSKGVTHEREVARRAGKPTLYVSWPDLSVAALEIGEHLVYGPGCPAAVQSAIGALQ